MKKIYYYPSSSNEGYNNPYSMNYKRALNKYFNVMESDNKKPKIQYNLILFVRSFQADIFIFNWIENVCSIIGIKSIIKIIIVLLSFCIIRLRRKKIVWMFHNIHPHSGENLCTRMIMQWLFKHADLIIAHSKDAEMFARKKSLKVKYECHPINDLKLKYYHIDSTYDILIWGQILSYKGIPEFLEHKSIRESSLRILVLGESMDNDLKGRIRACCTENIHFEERRASLDEIASYIKNSRYVLFPYIGSCVSSSGALMDTLVMGGTPIGPNKGAFKDLSMDNMCLVYNDFNELLQILRMNVRINESERIKFLKDHSWESFAYRFYIELSRIN